MFNNPDTKFKHKIKTKKPFLFKALLKKELWIRRFLPP